MLEVPDPHLWGAVNPDVFRDQVKIKAIPHNADSNSKMDSESFFMNTHLPQAHVPEVKEINANMYTQDDDERTEISTLKVALKRKEDALKRALRRKEKVDMYSFMAHRALVTGKTSFGQKSKKQQKKESQKANSRQQQRVSKMNKKQLRREMKVEEVSNPTQHGVCGTLFYCCSTLCVCAYRQDIAEDREVCCNDVCKSLCPCAACCQCCFANYYCGVCADGLCMPFAAPAAFTAGLNLTNRCAKYCDYCRWCCWCSCCCWCWCCGCQPPPTLQSDSSSEDQYMYDTSAKIHAEKISNIRQKTDKILSIKQIGCHSHFDIDLRRFESDFDRFPNLPEAPRKKRGSDSIRDSTCIRDRPLVKLHASHTSATSNALRLPPLVLPSSNESNVLRLPPLQLPPGMQNQQQPPISQSMARDA